jgi:hypothetical protein
MAKVKLKYVGYGITSRGINFSPDVNDGLYEVSKEDADYLLKTFPKAFILIEPVAETPKEKPARKRASRAKKTEE